MINKILKTFEPVLNKSLDRVESFIHSNKKVKYLFGAIFGAFDALLRSSKETTHAQPYIRNNYDVKRFMGAVLVALVFGWVMPAIYFYGWQCVASKLVVSFVIGVFVVDVIWAIIAKEDHISEGGFVTCLLIPAILPPQAPLWLVGLGSVLILSVFFSLIMGKTVAPPLFQLLSGGLILGAFFMATDPITTTYNQTAKWIYGAGCGFITVLIRDFTTLPEGVMYSILLMNLLAIPIQSLMVKIKYRI